MEIDLPSATIAFGKTVPQSGIGSCAAAAGVAPVPVGTSTPCTTYPGFTSGLTSKINPVAIFTATTNSNVPSTAPAILFHSKESMKVSSHAARQLHRILRVLAGGAGTLRSIAPPRKRRDITRRQVGVIAAKRRINCRYSR